MKGGGGAHTREKLVAAAADRFVVIVSSDKLVERVGAPIPLELHAYGLASTLRRLDLVTLRDAPPSPDGGVIADYHGDVERPRSARRGAVVGSRRRRPWPLPAGSRERGAGRPWRPGRTPRPAALGSRPTTEGSDVATATPLQLGMVGLGRMGANLVRRAMRGRPSLRGVRRLAPSAVAAARRRRRRGRPHAGRARRRCSSHRARSG